MKIRQIASAAAMMLTTCLLTTVSARAQAPVTIRIGYLHSELLDVPFIHGLQSGYFKDRGIDLQMVKFDNGTQINQALAGGSLEAAVAGAGVVENYAVQGNGVVIAPAYIDDNELYADPAQGVKKVADLAGKQVAFPLGTTANVLVYWAAEDAGIGYKAVKPVNMGYTQTAAGLLSGAVPSAVTFGAFSRLINREKPTFVKIATLKTFFPKRVVFGGLVTSNEYRKANRNALVRLAAAYIKSYSEIWTTEPARRKVWEAAYAKDESYEDFKRNLVDLPTPPSVEEWVKYLDDGSVAKWAIDVGETLKSVGAMKTIGDPKDFLDIALYKEAYAMTQSSKK